MTLEKGLRSQHGKTVQLRDSLGSPRAVNELPTISASTYHVIAIIIQQIVTLSKYGHDALDICHP